MFNNFVQCQWNCNRFFFVLTSSLHVIAVNYSDFWLRRFKPLFREYPHQHQHPQTWLVSLLLPRPWSQEKAVACKRCHPRFQKHNSGTAEKAGWCWMGYGLFHDFDDLILINPRTYVENDVLWKDSYFLVPSLTLLYIFQNRFDEDGVSQEQLNSKSFFQSTLTIPVEEKI